ncbi:hypothetical protein UlMin_017696 [Ulmus minor]
MASSTSSSYRYQVFLSFRGEDTRLNFTGHLYEALRDAGIDTFIDDDELRRGKAIRDELLQAIQGSRVSIIVFSRRYGDSSCCLDELVEIIKCRRTVRQIVIPIFYDVDPSDVGNQSGSFGEAFGKHEKRFASDLDRILRWREALTEAANLSGWDLRNTLNGHEAKFIKEIVKSVSKELNCTNLFVALYPIGIESRVRAMNSMLDVEPNDKACVGIWGMGGVGKTTIAKAAYNQTYDGTFGGRSFLANVREKWSQPNGPILLQEQLLSDILKSEVHVGSVDRGIKVIEERLRCLKVLILVDDVDHINQLNALARHNVWFGPGSRIIVTTRDEHVLKQLEVDAIYKAEEMNGTESLELFSWYAFRRSNPNEKYSELSRMVVDYCGGLPLALEVLGSFLYRRSTTEWQGTLEKLKRSPHRDIKKVLQIRFDGLEDDEVQSIFLDISCFFIELGSLPSLEILEISKSNVRNLPNLDGLSYLKHLLLDASRIISQFNICMVGTFKRHTGNGSKKDGNKVKSHQGKGGSRPEGASKNRGNKHTRYVRDASMVKHTNYHTTSRSNEGKFVEEVRNARMQADFDADGTKYQNVCT